MAGADVIGTAICIALLVIVAYVVAGSIITTAGMVTTTQMDMNRLQEERLNTDIVVAYYNLNKDEAGNHEVEFGIKNTGNTIINYTQMNMIIITQDAQRPTIYINRIGDGENGSSPVGTWRTDGIWAGLWPWPPEVVNPNQWDPGEYLYVWIQTNPHPLEFYVFTPNGATGQVTIL
jgi:archaellin